MLPSCRSCWYLLRAVCWCICQPIISITHKFNEALNCHWGSSSEFVSFLNGLSFVATSHGQQVRCAVATPSPQTAQHTAHSALCVKLLAVRALTSF